jgi:hypothetical protein
MTITTLTAIATESRRELSRAFDALLAAQTALDHGHQEELLYTARVHTRLALESIQSLERHLKAMPDTPPQGPTTG